VFYEFLDGKENNSIVEKKKLGTPASYSFRIEERGENVSGGEYSSSINTPSAHGFMSTKSLFKDDNKNISSNEANNMTRGEFVECVYDITQNVLYSDPLKVLINPSLPLLFVDEKVLELYYIIIYYMFLLK
jgi:hypothetical protein